MSVPIREAGPSDVVSLAMVQVRAWQQGYRGLMPDTLLDGLSVERHERRWRWLLSEEPRLLTVVAEVDKVVSGFCSVTRPSRDADADPLTAEIAGLYVDPQRWGQGIGSTLLEAVSDMLRRAAWNEVTLWVIVENLRARRLYERCAFWADGAERRESVQDAQWVVVHEWRLRLALVHGQADLIGQGVRFPSTR